MSPRRSRDSPNPSLACECAPPPITGGGGGTHTRLRLKGWGSPNSDDMRKSLALCLLCAVEVQRYLPLHSSLLNLAAKDGLECMR
jgi:hypothetical protein